MSLAVAAVIVSGIPFHSLCEHHLLPRGVDVVLEAEHLCMSLRDVQAAGSRTTTSALRGALSEDSRMRSQFLAE